jgi:hypothetical protein
MTQKFYHFILVIIACGFASVPNLEAASGFSIMAGNLGLNGQPNWIYRDLDFPEGAYLGQLNAGISSINATISLGKTLTAGRYYVFLKVTDYDYKGKINISLGGGSGTVLTDDRDSNGYWTGAITIDVGASASTMTLTFLKTIALGNIQKYQLLGLYITTNVEESVNRYDWIQNWHYPTQSEMDNSTPIKGNLIENSSFEAGNGHGWGQTPFNKDIPWNTITDNTVAFHGNASLKIHGTKEIVSKVFKVKPNKKYTLSAWVKSSYSANGIELNMVNVVQPPAGYPPQYVVSKSFPVGPNWQRVSVTGYLLNYPSNDYQIRIITGGATDYYTWIDAIQLEEGDLSSYDTKAPLEIGLLSDHSSHIFYEDEAISMNLNVYNNATVSNSGSVRYEVFDYLNRKVKGGALSVTAAAKSSSNYSLDLSTGKRGIFRVVLWIDNMDGTEEEVTYSVLPRPRITGLDETSLIGNSPEYTDFGLDTMQKMGTKWARAASPGAYFRWSVAEPQDNQFVWYDADVQKPAAHGIKIVGTIGANNYWPAWADVGGLPNLVKWEEFVEQLVNHYKDYVKYWEIWNEPYTVFAASFYADMLKRASSAIRRADPQAKIVGMGGSFPIDWVKSVIQNIGGNPSLYMDFISTHIYPGNGSYAQIYKNEIVNVYGIPVWNTETGVWDEGFYKGSNSSFFTVGTPIWQYEYNKRYYIGSLLGAEDLSINFLECLGYGLSKYFYYDARFEATPTDLKQYSLFEYDDTIRSKGIAYSILAYLFDHSTGLGNISTDPNTYAFLFDRGGTPLIALWTKDKSNKSIAINLTISQYKIYDLMGNNITTGSPIHYNRTPIYIEGQGISANTLKNAIQQGAISTVSDTAAPNLSIASGPRGTVSERDKLTITLRWVAIDDTSVPLATRPNAVLYSYRLVGVSDVWSDWTDKMFVDYPNLASGTYTFEVKAKDEVGNISPSVSRQFIIPGSDTVPPSAPKNLHIVN